MHEMAICQAILDQVQSQIPSVTQESPRPSLVKTITLAIGPLSGVEVHLVKQLFPLAASGTPCAEAVLVIHAPPIRIQCPDCNQESSGSPANLTCPRCGQWRTRLISGDEMILEHIELFSPS